MHTLDGICKVRPILCGRKLLMIACSVFWQEMLQCWSATKALQHDVCRQDGRHQTCDTPLRSA